MWGATSESGRARATGFVPRGKFSEDAQGCLVERVGRQDLIMNTVLRCGRTKERF